MEAPQKIIRHEINEDRANRDAFHLCWGIIALAALFLIVLGIAAFNSRFMLMPLIPREAKPTVQHTTISRGAVVANVCAAPFRLAAPRTNFADERNDL